MMATRIERIEIGAFGCLSDVVLTPAPGVNLLEAPNEAGKSTLAAFIKFVLYGFSSTRSQSIAENEKKLYMPWNGTRASGSLDVVCPSGSFRVERTYDLPAKEHVEIVNLQTRKPVFQSLVPGEVLFGAPEELFVKSAYFRQLFQSKNGDDALAEQVQNILFSADERISAEKAQKRLREAKAELRNAQNRGVIPELEGKLASYQAESERGTELNDRIRVCNETITKNTAELSRDREKLERLQDERRNIEKYAARTQLERLRAVDAAEAEAKRRYDSAAAEFSGADIPDTSAVKELMNDNAQYMAMLKERDRLAYESRTATDAYEATAAVCARWAGEEPAVRAALAREKRLFPTFLLLGVGLLAFGIACFFLPKLGAIFGGAALALGAAGLLAALPVKRRARALPAKFGYADKKELLCALSELPQIRKQCELEERRAYELNARYGESISRCGEMESSIAARIRRYRSEKDDGSTAELLDRLLNLSGEISALSAAYESARRARTEAFDGVDVEGLRTLAEGAQPPLRPAADVDREIRFHTQKIDSLNEIVRRAEREKAALEAQSPDLAALRGQMSAVEHTLRAANRRFAALQLALTVMDESSTYMRSTIAPKLTEYASECFRTATVGKYDRLLLDTRMGMTVETPAQQSLDYLSSGTKDSAYLCLRLALLRLLYAQSAQPPMVLDDVFARLDEKRLLALLSVLARTAAENGTQVFLFTCGARERLLLDKLGEPYTRLDWPSARK